MSARAATRDFEDRDYESFWIVIYGPGGTVEGEAEISCRDVRSAIMLAASTASPFGHGLRSRAGFIGLFEQALSAR